MRGRARDRDQIPLAMLGERGPTLSCPGIEGEDPSLGCQAPPPTHRHGSLHGACAGARREPGLAEPPSDKAASEALAALGAGEEFT